MEYYQSVSAKYHSVHRLTDVDETNIVRIGIGITFLFKESVHC